MRESENPGSIEAQNVEWKQSWRDEYLKWICGFANADGGTIYIGRDDEGEYTGLADAPRLLEDIPNKIVAKLGIVCDVSLLGAGDGRCIRIDVDPSPYPVSLNGEFHYRSGSTKQRLEGTALTRFLFDRMGFSWENVPVAGFDADDLWRESFSIFKDNALACRRMGREDFDCTDAELLERLNLVERGQITRAGVLLFSHYPEKHIPACYTRVGFFSDGGTIEFEDEVHGSLLEQAEKVVDLMYLKYMKARVSYERIARVERYAFPLEAVRELVLNALVHADWSRGIPLQIRVCEGTVSISNVAVPPRDLTVKKLLAPHRSEPYNPKVAQVFYRAGFIESWGRGIEVVRAACAQNGNPEPAFEIDSTGFTAVLFAPHGFYGKSDNKSDNKFEASTLEARVLALVESQEAGTQEEMAAVLGVARSTVSAKLKALQEKGLVVRSGARKNGKWVLVDAGRKKR